MKRAFVLFLMLAMICTLLPASSAGAQEASSANAEALAQGFLEQLENCPFVKPEDNRIGFGIDRIEKDGDNYFVYWSSTNDMINQNPNNMAYAFSLITFYDPEDYSNTYQGYTVVDGKINLNLVGGEEISYNHVRVNFPTSSKIVYMYFAGAPDGPDELYTKPLFYTLILDDNPRVYETTPREANNLFGE